MTTYKGYAGQVDFDGDAGMFGGTVIDAIVPMSFEGKSVADLRKSFRDMIDTYLEDCKAAGRQPEKPHNGTIIIRADPEIHFAYHVLAPPRRRIYMGIETTGNDVVSSLLIALSRVTIFPTCGVK